MRLPSGSDRAKPWRTVCGAVGRAGPALRLDLEVSVKQFWDERYAEADYAYGTAPNDFLVSVADRIPRGPVLCLAEGQGRNAVWLAARGHDVTAVDQSPVGMARAAELAAARGVPLHTVVADLAELPIAAGAWSGIVSISAHVPPPVRRAVHAAVVQGLAPGGVFVLEAYTPAQVGRGTGGPPVAELTMTLEGLRAELAGLTFLHAVETEREVREGRYHSGMAAVVQVLARKDPGATAG
ncbi:MAG: class I SAM-dependent methyltransferase [Alphaproteobacteria bacterium]|nr:class I SAM-dependent methyltransferase [Alphaproteobacteria bacterium]